MHNDDSSSPSCREDVGGKPGVTTLDSLMSSLGSVLLMWFVYPFISTKVSRLGRTCEIAKFDANAIDCNRNRMIFSHR